MRIKCLALLQCLVAGFLLISCNNSDNKITLQEKRILIFSKTAGYRHSSIEPGKLALMKLAADNGILADTTENDSLFTEEVLKQYSAVIFLNTTGNVLTTEGQAYFERYIQAGGGYVGIHAATDTEFDWPWYNKLAGAYFESHPEIQQAEIDVHDQSHPATAMLANRWQRTDEWYNFKSFYPGVNVLMSLDESSYKKYGTKDARRENYTPENHPIAWYHEYDGGRAFYTGGGHTDEAYSEELFLKHVLGGIEYAIGKNTLDYSRCKTPLPPQPDRFIRDVLTDNLEEPMELAVCPDGRVIFIERRGAVKVYLPNEKETRLMGKLEVFSDIEDGMLGITLHPEFYKNNTVFIYYSAKDKSVNRVSSFFVTYDSLVLASENVYLEVPVQRNECCHAGGSLKFGPDGNLYISTGDNTNPHQLGGYAPIDQRTGREEWDAGRTAGNTNDMRGKILRIKPLSGGKYEIPDGNLFPKNASAGLPEIYVMGCRNPFRISIDRRTGTLYWGEVGPDSHIDSTMGPRGYDEVNRAHGPGNFGWPFFIADNKAYAQVDFETAVVGEKFNPLAPVNESRSNTGMKFLPPAQKALIWYPYAATKDFVNLGSGGRNAMAGPVYYYNDYPNNGIKLPKFYDKSFIFYDWIRDHVRAVRFNDEGKIKAIDPLFTDMTFSHIIDMEMDRHGTIYTLEYGPNWFVRNKEARLSRIYYTEKNIPPVPVITHERAAGKEPFTLTIDASKSYDLDKKDELSFSYKTGTEGEYNKVAPIFDVVFEKAGIYPLTVRVTDRAGDFSEKTIEVQVGNAIPQLEIVLRGNQSFYVPGNAIQYAAEVRDLEDGSTQAGKILRDKIKLGYRFIKNQEQEEATLGHQSISGAALLDKNDCKSCHHLSEKSAGPSYLAIASRYDNTPENRYLLANKVRTGGSGVWGEINMSAHPELSVNDAIKILDYILSVNEALYKPIPSAGTLMTEQEKQGTYIFEAVYSDNPVGNIPSLQVTAAHKLQYPQLQTTDANDYRKNIVKSASGSHQHRPLWANDWLGFTGYDFRGLRGLNLEISVNKSDDATLLVLADSMEGRVVARIPLKVTTHEGKPYVFVNKSINFESSLKDATGLYFKVEALDPTSKVMVSIDRIGLQFE